MSLLKRIIETLQSAEPPKSTPAPNGDEPERTAVAFARPIINQIQQLALTEGVGVDEMTLEILQAGVAKRQAYHQALRMWHTLTPREKDVSALICMGCSNDEIAGQMHIARGTVRTHIRHILKKFRVENRLQVRDKLWWWDFETWAAGV